MRLFDIRRLWPEAFSKLPEPDLTPQKQVDLMPTPQESELRHLRLRVNELMRENDELRRGAGDSNKAAKRFDIALIKQADNAQAQAIKFNRVKDTVRQMKVLYGQTAAYLASLPKAGLSAKQKAAIEDMQHAAEVIGAIDPDLYGLSRAEVQRVIEGKQLARAVLAGVDVVNQLSTDHNPPTSNNGALAHDRTQEAQTEAPQGSSAGGSPYGQHPSEDDGESG